jgi:hypothetical protein
MLSGLMPLANVICDRALYHAVQDCGHDGGLWAYNGHDDSWPQIREFCDGTKLGGLPNRVTFESIVHRNEAL